MYKNKMLSALMLFCGLTSFAQQLENVPPVLVKEKTNDSVTSFALATWDGHSILNYGHQEYGGSVQIVDADNPWPPRWFYALTNEDFGPVPDENGARRFRFNILANLDLSNQEFTMYKFSGIIHKRDLVMEEGGFAGYIICNSELEPVDTILGSKIRDISSHELSINKKNERLTMISVDTTVNLSSVSNNPKDTIVKLGNEIFKIFNPAGQEIFRWNFLEHLDLKLLNNILSKKTDGAPDIDLTHDADVQWDLDGDIIFNLRYIGIGKISRKDGHVIWLLDKLPGLVNNDTFSFSQHHNFNALAENDTAIKYSLFLNGDDQHKTSFAVEFSVSKKNPIVVSGLRKITPSPAIYSEHDGNYESNKDGSFLFNYGLYPIDTTIKFHPSIEYKSGKDTVRYHYQLPAMNFVNKAHFLNFKKPARPVITNKKGQLTANGSMTGWVWYKLSGPQFTQVKAVANGATFKPTEPGAYCVIGRLGIGYAASTIFNYTK